MVWLLPGAALTVSLRANRLRYPSSRFALFLCGGVLVGRLQLEELLVEEAVDRMLECEERFIEGRASARRGDLLES
jgi:hypothetical protein